MQKKRGLNLLPFEENIYTQPAKKKEENKIDYSKFGGKPVSQPVDYSKFGGKQIQEKPKAGPLESAWLGAQEAVLGIPALLEQGVAAYSEPLEKYFHGEEYKQLPPEQETPISTYLSKLPESEDQISRRIRTGTSGIVGGSVFGVPGILAGLVGSQAGQTVREVYGKDGKFDKFGWGETGAIAADLLAGGTAGALASLAKQAPRAAAETIPAIFQQPKSLVQRAVVKNVIQGDKKALENIINDFSTQQIKGFEETVNALSPNRYTELTESSASALKRNAEDMFRNTQLSTISPLEVTKSQGGQALQEAANSIFETTVLQAEKQAYGIAREAAADLTGTAPKTLEQAKSLRNDLLKTDPTPEQNPVIRFLNGLIDDLEKTTEEKIVPASKLVKPDGTPLIPETKIPASSVPRTRQANELVQIVQNGNHAVNYGSEIREQSHRLKPILSTLREEVGEILSQNSNAFNLYREANKLHATNARNWNTKFMRGVRFSENPEIIPSKLKLASNLRNLKIVMSDASMQSLAERMLIDEITSTGSTEANRKLIFQLKNDLSPTATNAAEQLIQIKDPLTSTGGRRAIANNILEEAAKSVNTGQRPEKILELMTTPKGYRLVKETMGANQQSRELFKTYERLFLEDIFNSILDKNGVIDFQKARNIFKKQDIRNVVSEIGGENLVNRFNQLEQMANNLEKNITLYKSPQTKTFFQKVVAGTKSAGLVGAILHSLHVPTSIIAGLGLIKGGGAITKIAFDAIKTKILSNPRAVKILDNISKARSIDTLSEQIPRLLTEIEKNQKSD